MIDINSPGRLSARWKVFPARYSLLPFIGLLLIFLTACKDKSSAQQSMKSQDTTGSLSKPKVDIKVNRHFDDKGNMIGFDSTYSSYYSSIQGDTSRMDSVFRDFDQYFRKQHQAIFNNRFNDVFFKDSLRYPDFFHDDFFSQRYRLNDRYFRDMMSQMDSIKNKYYRDKHGKQKP